jgi:opacity protein-like surface antigen
LLQNKHTEPPLFKRDKTLAKSKERELNLNFLQILFMKKYFCAIVFMAMMSVGVYAQEQGSKSLGASVVFGSGIPVSNIGLQAKFRYSFTDTWRIEGSGIYFFEKKVIAGTDGDGFSSTDFSVNLHYCFPVSEQFTIYPLAGLGYMTWNGQTEENTYKTMYGVQVPDGTKKVDSKESNFGLNIGAGVDFRITDKISANAELRYRFSDKISFKRTYFSLGICYAF